MNNTMTLAFNNTEVRSITADDEIWFALVDVCKILELSNSRRVAQRLDEDERRNFKLPRQGDTWFVNEPGLYHVILTSKSERLFRSADGSHMRFFPPFASKAFTVFSQRKS